MKKLFSIKKDNCRYILSLCGIKLKFASSKLMIKEIKRLQRLQQRNKIPTLYLANLTKEQKIWHLSQIFYEEVGYFPNLKNPKSFNEKLHWLKLNYYNPIEQICVDKYEFKQYIKEQLGEGYTVPLIGVFNDVNDIDFDKLPNQFVIKTTANGGANGVEIVKDKSKINIDELKYRFNNLMQDWHTLYHYYFNRGYKNIKQRIIIEEYLEQTKGQLFDYKFYCFHGEPKWVLACCDRAVGTSFENHDLDWNLFIPSNKSSKITKIAKPRQFKKMLEISNKLASQFPFVRVDFYEVGNKIYVGELTFYPASGFNAYTKEWDYKFGQWLDLDKINLKYVERN